MENDPLSFLNGISKKRVKPYTGPNEAIAHKKTRALFEKDGDLTSTDAEQVLAAEQIEMIAKLQGDKAALNEYLKSIGR